MKKCKFFFFLVMTFSTMSVFSQSYPVEVSLSIGDGFYWTPSSMVINDVYTRENQMALVNGGTPFPAFETMVNPTSGNAPAYAIYRDR